MLVYCRNQSDGQGKGQSFFNGDKLANYRFWKEPTYSKWNSFLLFRRAILPSKIQSSTRRLYLMTKFWKKRTYFSTIERIELTDGESFRLPAGDHQYPFSFQLPIELPSSFEGEFGYVSYTIKVLVNRPWHFDYETKVAISVNSIHDLNTASLANVSLSWKVSRNWSQLLNQFVWIIHQWQQEPAQVTDSKTICCCSNTMVLRFGTDFSPCLDRQDGLCSGSVGAVLRLSGEP